MNNSAVNNAAHIAYERFGAIWGFLSKAKYAIRVCFVAKTTTKCGKNRDKNKWVCIDIFRSFAAMKFAKTNSYSKMLVKT